MLLFRCQSGVAGAAGLRHIHLVEFIGKLVVIVGKPLHRFSYPASDASNRRIISQPLVPYRAAKNGYVPKSPLRYLQCSGSAIGRHNNALKIGSSGNRVGGFGGIIAAEALGIIAAEACM